MVLSAIAGLFGVGLLVVLTFKMAIFALPLFVGVTAGRLAFDTGAGLPGALAVGALSGLAAFAGARALLGRTRNLPLRTALALAFAASSAFAGYYLCSVSRGWGARRALGKRSSPGWALSRSAPLPSPA